MITTPIQEDILLSTNTTPIIYDFGVSQHNISKEKIIKNQIKAVIKKTLIQKDSLGYLYFVETIDRSQTNLEGILKLENSLALLQKKIALYTDPHGKIISIINRGEIKENWYDLSKKIKKEFAHIIPKMDTFLKGIDKVIDTNDSFVSLIKKSELFTLLFPPIYNNQLLNTAQIHQEKDFDNFFDTTTLPLAIQTTLTGINSNTKEKQVLRSGKLDHSRFDKENATKLFTESYGTHQSNTDFKVSYLETLDLDEFNIITKGNGMLGVTVEDLYSFRQMSMLKKKDVHYG
ncbi:hypothetical protein [Aquimarina longa]|uniref:hypothetical protein n=1 Tax=Aquimarina longa TaxID=1080221 RepID=UPI000781884F|nr:hypothetical protein [Aquimarina longa]